MSMINRVRFAPSPTGYLHLGGLRTALFNYLHARSTGGKFILRIEDTDRTRFVPGAVDNLLEVFKWLGLEFDEGPHLGGECVPYVQSERLDIYRKHVDMLSASGKAYRCFCTAERLEQMREAQTASGQNPMYDRKCRNISAEESTRRAQSEPYVIRMSIPDSGEVTFIDGVRGEVSFDNSTIDDQVLMKSDGFPTYHLANVVDDHLMGVDCVIRGEEWLISTPKHIHLYDFFGWDKPRFYHLPLLLNKDRSKLSKRQGDVAVEDYRAKGYLPQALINYTALLGWHPSDDREIFTLPELIQAFSLDRTNKAGAVFDVDKLNWVNKQHLNMLSPEEFLLMAAPYIPDGFEFASEAGQKLLVWLREGIDKITDIPARLSPFFWDWTTEPEPEVAEMLKVETSKKVYSSVLTQKGQITEWNAEVFKNIVNLSGKTAGVKGKDLWMAVRAAATGSLHGPEMALIALRMGKDKFFDYIEKADMY